MSRAPTSRPTRVHREAELLSAELPTPHFQPTNPPPPPPLPSPHSTGHKLATTSWLQPAGGQHVPTKILVRSSFRKSSVSWLASCGAASRRWPRRRVGSQKDPPVAACVAEAALQRQQLMPNSENSEGNSPAALPCIPWRNAARCSNLSLPPLTSVALASATQTSSTAHPAPISPRVPPVTTFPPSLRPAVPQRDTPLPASLAVTVPPTVPKSTMCGPA